MSEGTSLHPARPTVYKGIQMRSRLEAGYAAWLDRWHFDWEYEPCAFAHPELGQYLPDFLLRNVVNLTSASNVYVEVKPNIFDVRTVQNLERAARIIKANDYDAEFVLACPPPRLGSDEYYTAVLSIHGLSLHAEICLWAPRFYGDEGPLALVHLLSAVQGPWYGEWWKGVD